jgi:putative tryptophan/tyrosine transport system substrate-binding protein
MVSDRRKFITLVGTAFAGWPVLARAQTSHHIRTIGVLMGLANDAETHARAEAFERGLSQRGWIVNKNLRILYRFSGGDFGRMQTFAKEFTDLKVDCILGHSTPVVTALMQATKTIPIVFVSVTDPIGSGFVKSIAHPGGNATGFTILQASITGKYLSMLQEIAPHINRVAIIYNPQSAPGAGTFFLKPFIAAAKEFKIKPIIAEVHNDEEIRDAIGALAASADSGLIVMPDNFTTLHRQQFISLAAQLKVPAIYPYKYFAEEGGLLAYGVDAVDLFRRASDYVSRILNGAAPATLPVQAPIKFELVINLKAARTLGIEMPRTLLAAADAIIE